MSFNKTKKFIFKNKYLISKVKLNPNDLPSSPYNNIHNKIFNNQPGIIAEKEHVNIDVSKLKEGDLAPKAYVGKIKFPEWYRPYSLNYYGHGYLVVSYVLLGFIIYIMRKQVAMANGRDSFVDYRHEHKLFNGLLYKRYAESDRIKSDKIDMYRYLSRYIKESGF